MSTPLLFDNPVYDGYLADPFCWFHEGIYYAIGTGEKEAEGDDAETVVPMVKSTDLQHWTAVGNVLIVPDAERGGRFWAPETAYDGSRFTMYYHPNGNGKGFRIRAAVSEKPDGPYRDTGMPLTNIDKNSFAIDSHAFRDDDGQWYLFYATDFHDFNSRTFRGTAVVMDKMVSMTQLEGNPKIVMRAHWPWQLFELNRDMAGLVADWYTLEGPCVYKRGDRYYCFYSGGCYENDTYGVDYLVADSIDGPWQEIGREHGPQIMRSIPGEVIGPGHFSIVASPEGQDYVVYHAWNKEMTKRQMWIDPLNWTNSGPRIERFAGEIETASRE